MRLTKRQLNILIENYIYEQEDGAPPVDDEDSGDPPVDDEASPPEEEPETEPEEIKPPKSFKIDIAGQTYTIAFKKENKKMVVYVDDVLFKAPKPNDMLALAGIGLQGVEDEDTKNSLAKIIIAMDSTMNKFDGNVTKIKNDIGAKIKGSRPPYSIIASIIQRAKG